MWRETIMDKQAQRTDSVPVFDDSPPTFDEEESTNVSATPTQQAYKPTEQSFGAVKEMQQAMVNFASILAAHPVMSMQDVGQQERKRRSGISEELGGTNPFGNFLVSQYVNNSDIVGKEFMNIGLGEPLRTQTATPNVNLKSIIRTIGVIGHSGAENKPDGVWQTRTNNALKQIYAVGLGLFQFAKDLDINIKGFDQNELKEFGKLIPKSYTDLPADKSKLAGQITEYINALTDLYKKFENAVLEQPEYKELIEQNKPLVDHSGQAKTALTKDEQSFIDANRSSNIPGAVINGKAVRLADLAGPVAFKNFLQSANVDVSRPNEIQKQLASIKKMIAVGNEAGF